MNDIPSKERTKALLTNWADWARDCPPDWAEVDYYNVCAMFSHIIPRASGRPYNEESALLVEDVLRMMHKHYRKEWIVLVGYYGNGEPQAVVAKRLGVHQSNISRHWLPMAQRIFSEQWGLMIRTALD